MRCVPLVNGIPVFAHLDADGRGRVGKTAIVDRVHDGKGEEGNGAGPDNAVDGALHIRVVLEEATDKVSLLVSKNGDGAPVETADDDDDKEDPERDGECAGGFHFKLEGLGTQKCGVRCWAGGFITL